MAEAVPQGPIVQKVSLWIEHDIRERGLRVGEPYLTAADLAGVVGVSRATADRAMRHLAERGILTRSQRSGSFVGPRAASGGAPPRALDVVHVLLSTDYIRAGLIAPDVLADTLSTTLEGAAIDMHFIPESDSYQYVSRVIQRIRSAGGSSEGVVMIRASRDAQSQVQASGIPAVVLGTAYPEIQTLPWIDVDQADAGRVAARYCLDSAYRRFALLTRDQWRRGDNLLLEGVTRELAEAGVKLDELNIISIPYLERVIERQVLAILGDMSEPVALICRDAMFANAALRAAATGGYEHGRDYLLISTQTGPGPTPFAHISAAMDAESQIRWVGERLIELAGGMVRSGSAKTNSDHEPAHLLVPAVLVKPKSSEVNVTGGAPTTRRGRNPST